MMPLVKFTSTDNDNLDKVCNMWVMYNTLMTPYYSYCFLPDKVQNHKSRDIIEQKVRLALSNNNILKKFICQCNNWYVKKQITILCQTQYFNMEFWVKMVLYCIEDSKGKPYFVIKYTCCRDNCKFIKDFCNVVLCELSKSYFNKYCKQYLQNENN